MSRLAPFLFLLAGIACGTTSVGVGVGGGSVGAGASATVAPAHEQPNDATCIYDPSSGELRTCQDYSAGNCAVFGDRCSEEPQQGAGGSGESAPR